MPLNLFYGVHAHEPEAVSARACTHANCSLNFEAAAGMCSASWERPAGRGPGISTVMVRRIRSGSKLESSEYEWNDDLFHDNAQYFTLRNKI